MTLIEEISRIKISLREGRFPNETSISQGIVLPILQSLGWKVFDSRYVFPEYSIGGGRVDLALLDHRSRASIFIEVKMIGKIEGSEKQLFEYAFHQGVPFLVLTDGQEWNFYLPLTQGSYQERKLYKLDLLERDIQTILEKFNRYLIYDKVINGDALDSAQCDFREITRHREAENAIPEAWKSLLEDHNDTIMELLIDKVEDLCGFKPEKESCESFLENLYKPQSPAQNTITIKNYPSKNSRRQPDIHNLGFNFRGQYKPARSAREVMMEIIKLFASGDYTFLDRFSVRAHGDKRSYISKNKMDLYPNRPDFCEDKSMTREILPGWWIGLNYSKKSIDKIIKLAIEVAGLRIGKDIEYNLGNSK